MARKKSIKSIPGIQQLGIVALFTLAVVVLLSLITHSPSDPSLFVTSAEDHQVRNAVGHIGSYISGLLYGFFGYFSYILPVMLVWFAIMVFSEEVDVPKFNKMLVLTGIVVSFIFGTGLMTLLFPDSTLKITAGGLLGYGVAHLMHNVAGDLGSILLLFFGLFSGITLVFNIDWLRCIDGLGDIIVETFTAKPKAGSLWSRLKHKWLIFVAGLGAFWAAIKSRHDSSHDEVEDALFVNSAIDERIDPSLNDDDSPSFEVPEHLAEPFNDVPGEPNSDPKKSTKSSGAIEAKGKAVSIDKLVNLPAISLLEPEKKSKQSMSKRELETMAQHIIDTLESYGVKDVDLDSYYPGPVVTRFELALAPGTKVSKVSGLGKDIARSIGVHSIRIVDVISGKTTIGIEVPNEYRQMVVISEILKSNIFREAPPLTLALGKTIAGKPAVASLAKMPHLLVAGTTGSGKSVGVNAMLLSMLYKSTPDEVRLILIDPKMLELSIYEGIPHLLTPVVTDMKDAANSLRWCVMEMEKRYALMSHLKVRNIDGYNDKVRKAIEAGQPINHPDFDPNGDGLIDLPTLEPLPYIVVVIDEFADMMMVVGKKVEELIARLAQKARAAGIHLILATQRPSVDVITGLIKANIPSRIAFQVSTKIDSRTILDQGGAEQLLGHGDMLYLPPGTGMPQRVHGAFVSDEEVDAVVTHLKLQGEPNYVLDVGSMDDDLNSPLPGLEPVGGSDGSEQDVLYDEAVAIVLESRRASISYIQRRLKVGYNRAASMMDEMEAAGVVSAVQSNGTREILVPDHRS